MEHVSSKIVNRMISAELISESEADQYNYCVQILIEKIISYSVASGCHIKNNVQGIGNRGFLLKTCHLCDRRFVT